MGGRRRRTGRKQRGGNFYGVVGGDPALGSAGARYDAVSNDPVDQSGAAIPEAVMPKVGGRRRRTGKKRMTRRGGRKSRRVMPRRKRTMRGGASWYSPSVAGGAFVGNGSAGLPNLTGYSVNTVAGGPVENFDGAMRTSS
jgi:hypothetical protein